jgi:hypothetical protein
VRNFALVNIHEDVKMQGYITYTGSSSMEVTIDILAARPDRDDLLAETKFIMVARAGDKAGKVPGLLLANDEVNSWFCCCYLVESCCKHCCVGFSGCPLCRAGVHCSGLQPPNCIRTAKWSGALSCIATCSCNCISQPQSLHGIAVFSLSQ